MRNKESTYQDEVEEILAECRRNVDEAYRQYEWEIDNALQDFRKNFKKPQTWVH